jgi:hypothetical protein
MLLGLQGWDTQAPEKGNLRDIFGNDYLKGVAPHCLRKQRWVRIRSIESIKRHKSENKRQSDSQAYLGWLRKYWIPFTINGCEAVKMAHRNQTQQHFLRQVCLISTPSRIYKFTWTGPNQQKLHQPVLIPGDMLRRRGTTKTKEAMKMAMHYSAANFVQMPMALQCQPHDRAGRRLLQW